MGTDWDKVKKIFAEVIGIEPAERAGYISLKCGGDEELRREIETLLDSHERAGDFIQRPAAADAVDLPTLALAGESASPPPKLGQYRILSELGRGGMGAVYLAEDPKLKRRVAIKMLPCEFAGDPDRVRRFRREAHVISSLNHPNIVTIHEVGETPEGHEFIVTELVDGKTLRDILSERTLPLPEAIGIFLQTAKAIAVAHEHGVIHRDIKPENIMIRKDGLVKVLDFGIAKPTERGSGGTADLATLTKSDHLFPIGTPKYMSPEQMRGLAVDERTDVWSLACVLYEMVAGFAPFTGATTSDIIVAVLERDPVPCTPGLADSDAGLRAAVAKALSKDREARHRNVHELIGDIARIQRRLADHTSAQTTQPMHLVASKSEPSAQTDGAGRNAQTVIADIAEDRRAGGGARRGRRVFSWRIAAAFAAFVIFSAGGVGIYRFAGFSSAGLVGPTPKTGMPASAEPELTKVTQGEKISTIAISADGRYLAYLTPGPEGFERLRLRQTSTNSDMTVVEAKDVWLRNPTFSADGEQIYYFSISPKERALLRVPVLGGEPTKIASGVLSGASPSPDGKSIAFVAGGTGENDPMKLVIANPDGTGQRTVFEARAPRFLGKFVAPAWSPDGGILAVRIITAGPDAQRYQIVGINLADGSERALSDRQWDDVEGLVWLRDGSLLAVGSEYSDDRRNSDQLWRIDPASGEHRRLTNDLSNYRSLGATPDGKTIALVRADEIGSFWVANVSDPEGAEKVGSTTVAYHISWTPDGRLLYCAENELYLMNADGTGRRKLTEGQGQAYLPSMTVDGRYIVFVRSLNRKGSIWRMDPDGSNEVQLTSGLEEWYPTLSADGKYVNYVSYDEKARGSLWRVPVEGGSPEKLLDPLGHGDEALKASPVDERLAFYHWERVDGQTAIGVFDPAKNETKVIKIPDRKMFGELGWARDGRAVTLMGPGGNIWSLPLDGSKATPLTNYKSEPIKNYALSPDGKKLAMIRVAFNSDIVLMQNLN